MNGCIFCRIVKGTAPASTVYSDDIVMAFMDTLPVNAGHVLIIPKTHAAELSQLDEKVGAHMFKVAMRIDTALRSSGTKCEGVTMLLADGEAASQDILHVHLHVVPRFRGDGFGVKFGPDHGLKPSRKELDNIAQKIARSLH